MKVEYKQLSFFERVKIEALFELGISARGIAKKLGRSNKCISNELRCNGDDMYNAHVAQTLSEARRSKAKKHSKCTDKVKDVILSLLTLGMSPEQIQGRMKVEDYQVIVSTNTIYRLVDHEGWRAKLARKGKVYRSGSKASAGAKLIPNRVDIDKRPVVVDEKEEIGHWEGDTVYGQDGYFVTMVERVSKLLLTCRVKNKSKHAVTEAINSMMRPFISICKTITFDNGGEFAGHEDIQKSLECDVFFAKPYHSWERGLNENTNGLLRRFFPKGMAIGQLAQKEIENAQFLINIRPRKLLNYLSPYEFLTGKSVSLIVEI
jgi:IS30 family transposase